MNTDVAFVTGCAHRLCQDYARCGPNYILISDGCSGSPDSDFGSRVLVKTVENLILAGKLNLRDAIITAAIIIKNLGLQEVSLDATLMMAQVNEKTVNVSVFGDGFILVKNRDKTERFIKIEFPSGYPYYLNYIHNPDRRNMIRGIYEQTKAFKQVFSQDPTQMSTTHVNLNDDDELNGFTLSLPIDEISSIVLMSDGVGSFSEKTTRTPVQAQDIVKQLCGFKNTTGEAVQRRMNAFLRDAYKNNLTHDDDVSVGAIFFE